MAAKELSEQTTKVAAGANKRKPTAELPSSSSPSPTHKSPSGGKQRAAPKTTPASRGAFLPRPESRSHLQDGGLRGHGRDALQHEMHAAHRGAEAEAAAGAPHAPPLERRRRSRGLLRGSQRRQEEQQQPAAQSRKAPRHAAERQRQRDCQGAKRGGGGKPRAVRLTPLVALAGRAADREAGAAAASTSPALGPKREEEEEETGGGS